MTDSIPDQPLPGDQHAAQPGSGLPPPPPPPPGSAPRLTRSTTDRYIGGVCGGLGAHFHVDPLIFRVLFAALVFAGGIGLVLYLAGWVLIPEAGSQHRIGWDSLASMKRHDTRLVVAGLIAVLAVVLLADNLHFAHEGALWGVALVGAGVLLLLQERRQSAPGIHPAMTAPPGSYGGGAFAAAPAPTAAPSWTGPRLAGPRSILGLVTVAAAMLAVGVAALLDSVGLVSVSVATGSAIALIVIGAGLLAGSWFGRSRGLIVLGVLLLPFTAAATLVTEPLSGGTGNVTIAPQTLADVNSQYHLAAGQLTVDLSQIPLSASRAVTVTVALGQLTVVVPPQANVSIAAHTGAGHIDLLGASDDGVNIDSTLSHSPSPGGGLLRLALSVGFGEVDVVRSTGTPAQGT